jgi:hypothetical protein
MPKVSDKNKEYICNHCSKSYVYQSGLCNHIKSAHHDIYLLKKQQKNIAKKLASNNNTAELDLLQSLDDRDYLRTFIEKSGISFKCDIVLVITSLLIGQVKVYDGNIEYLKDSKEVIEPISDIICERILKEYTDCIIDILYQRIKTKDKDSLIAFDYVVTEYINQDNKKVSNKLRSNMEKTLI